MNTTRTSAARTLTRRHTDRPSVADLESVAVAQSDIAQRAYELFLARGGTHGNDIEDWLTAERELKKPGSPGRTGGRKLIFPVSNTGSSEFTP